MAVLALSLTGCSPTDFAVTTTVDTHDAVIDGTCDDGSGHCSLRAALEEANATVGQEPVVTVPGGTYPVTLGTIVVDRPGTVVAKQAGASPVVVDLSANGSRLFTVAAGTNLDVTGFTITGAVTTGDGGAVAVAGTLGLHRSTIDGNSATGNGGAISIASGGVVSVTTSTIDGNTAGGSGQAMANGGTLNLWHATVAAAANGVIDTGAGATTTLLRSIVFGGATSCTGVAPVSGGRNVSGDASCASGGTDLVADPLLGPLADGVRVPASTSPAAGIIPVASNPASLDICDGSITDQLGVARPHGGACDAGAVETNAAPVCPSDWSHLIGASASGTLACTDADGDPVSGYEVVANGTSGAVNVNPVTGAFTASGVVSGESFTYRATDGNLTSNAAPVALQTSAPVDMFFPPENRNCAAFCNDVAMGDLDSDGDLDIVATGQEGAFVVYKSLAGTLPGTPGDFPGAYYATGSNPYYVDLGDVDADGDLDAVVTMLLDNTAWVYLNDGNGGFGTHVVLSTGANPLDTRFGDVNGDGAADVLVTSTSVATSVSFFLSNGDGTFGTRVDLATTGVPRSAAFGLVDADANLDIVAIVPGTGNYSVFLGHGDGTFAAESVVTGSAGPGWVGLADLDEDGTLDIVGIGDTNTVLLGNGDGTFGAPSVAFGAAVSRVLSRGVLTDLDGDGHVDLAVTGYDSSQIAALLGNGDGTFAPATALASGGWHNVGLAAGDFNGDGKIDLVHANGNGQAIGLNLQK